jgi:hypothetical protein
MPTMRALPDEPGYALEGKIWQPRALVPLGGTMRRPRSDHDELVTVVAQVVGEAEARGDSV